MEKAKKFTKTQLSTILSHAHELVRRGITRYSLTEECPAGCINQVAYNVADLSLAYAINPVVAEKFDCTCYAPSTPNNILRMLERLGAA